MTARPQNSDDEWNPATSNPGEVYTPEGQIKLARAFALGLRNHDPRAKAYRWSMMKPGLVIVALGLAAIVVVALLNAIL